MKFTSCTCHAEQWWWFYTLFYISYDIERGTRKKNNVGQHITIDFLTFRTFFRFYTMFARKSGHFLFLFVVCSTSSLSLSLSLIPISCIFINDARWKSKFYMYLKFIILISIWQIGRGYIRLWDYQIDTVGNQCGQFMMMITVEKCKSTSKSIL